MSVVFPGDCIASLPSDGVVKVDRSVVRVGNELHCVQSGILEASDTCFRVQTCGRRYNNPVVNERVLGIVTGSFAEEYKVDIKSPSLALLPKLAFENATKRNRPLLKTGDTIFCRVTSSSQFIDPEVSCVNHKGIADGLGSLSGGSMFETSTQHCLRLLQKRRPELELIQNKVAYEITVGRNGRVWVKSGEPNHTAVIVSTLQDCERVDDVEEVEKIVKKHFSRLNMA